MNAWFRAFVRIAVIVGGTLVVLLIGAVGLFWFYAPDVCGNEIVAEYPSPDANRRVVVFERDCGATTGFSTQASVLDAGEVLRNESGNAFIADTNHGAAPSGPGGGPALSVNWTGADSVRFSFHPKARVFKREVKVNGVGLSYDRVAQQTDEPDAEKARGASR